MLVIKKSSCVVSLFTAIALLLLIHQGCNRTAKYHSFLNEKEYEKLSRIEQLAKCATCHKQEFENEMQGPHANAYSKLMEHIEFINSNKYDCRFYTLRTNKQLEDCMECHAPVNLFETRLLGGLSQKDSIAERLLHGSFLPDSRMGTSYRSTGVDCFTCHYDGTNMISLKPVLGKTILEHGKTTISKVIADNINCFPCHDNEFKTFNPAIAITQKGNTNCVSCHQEYDAKGKPTHYFYWSHDPATKTNSNLTALMNDFSLRLDKNKNIAEIAWRNTSVPHKLAPFPETILKCEVLAADSSVLGTKTIRLNNRKEFNKLMYESCGNNYLPGEDGEEVMLNDSVKNYPVTLHKKSNATLFKITLLHKGQYWFPDSFARSMAVKISAIK